MKDKILNMNDIEAVLRPDVRLSRCELADLFEVYYGTITANIKAIIRSGVLKPSFEGPLIQVGKTVLPERYDTEMVIALAFRLNSPAAEQIRKYVIKKSTARTDSPIFISYTSCSTVN